MNISAGKFECPVISDSLHQHIVTYAEALQGIGVGPDTDIKIDLCDQCASQPLWYCVTHLHFDTLMWIFNRGMGAIALAMMIGALCVLFTKFTTTTIRTRNWVKS